MILGLPGPYWTALGSKLAAGSLQYDARYLQRNRDLLQQAFRAPLLFSRSLVLVLEKRDK